MSVDQADKLHRDAMALSAEAFSKKIAGRPAEFRRLLTEAFLKEKNAADAIADMLVLEPTRSILHRSAATLAIELGETGQAEKLIYRALAGDAPNSVAEELKNLLEQVSFKRHLELHGLELRDDEIQMAISGDAADCCGQETGAQAGAQLMSTLLLGVAIGFCLGVSFGLEVARYWVTRKGG